MIKNDEDYLIRRTYTNYGGSEMSKCSKKCNEIKAKIDSISGLDDDIVYSWLKRLDTVTDAIVGIIDDYEKRNKLNGTCFKS